MDSPARQEAAQAVPAPKACLSARTPIVADTFVLDLSGGYATIDIALLHQIVIEDYDEATGYPPR